MRNLILSVVGVSNNNVKYIRSNVQVTSMPGLPVNATAPKLTGQTTALADHSGRINISDVLLVAEPHVYNLSVRLQDRYMVGHSLYACLPACLIGSRS